MHLSPNPKSAIENLKPVVSDVEPLLDHFVRPREHVDWKSTLAPVIPAESRRFLIVN